MAFVLLVPENSFGRTVPLQNASILRQSINLQFKLERELNFVLRMPIPTRFWQIAEVMLPKMQVRWWDLLAAVMNDMVMISTMVKFTHCVC